MKMRFQLHMTTIQQLSAAEPERPTREDDQDVLGHNETCDACTTDDLEPVCRGLCFGG